MRESIAELISRRKRENPTPEEAAAAAAYCKQLKEDVENNQKIHFASGPTVIDGKALERHRSITG
jgi:hypothetical protein